jgi:TPP-dependent pyruvate/acetoin dehydrogenase alpha subunit
VTAKLRKKGQVVICFFGDNATSEGMFHESINLASVWDLPVVFVCENNGYAESTPWGYHCAAKSIVDRAVAYDMPGVAVDGTDFFAVYEAAEEAIGRARRGEGPCLMECRAFRYYGHFEGDAMLYVTKEEKERNRARDPIENVRKRAIERGIVTEAQLAEVDAQAAAIIEAAVKFAEESSWPKPEEVLTDVYVNYP